jgi:sugar phosphate isomerase/epimerase
VAFRHTEEWVVITLSASTLGAPGQGLDEVLSDLHAAGLRAVELRFARDQIADPVMTAAGRRQLRERLAAAGVAVSALASYIRLAADAPDELVLGALAGAVQVAADLGAPAVRVFPGAPTEAGPYDQVPRLHESREAVDERAARRLSAAAPLAAEAGVLLCLETHDSHPTGAHVAGLLERVAGPVGAVWDLMHPWRVGESLETSWSALQPWLARSGSSVQVKDAALPIDRTPRPIGEGSLPVDAFAELLVEQGWSGPVTLEWERAWHPTAAPLAVALTSLRTWADRYWPEREAGR